MTCAGEAKHILLGWEVVEWPAVFFVGRTKWDSVCDINCSSMAEVVLFIGCTKWDSVCDINCSSMADIANGTMLLCFWLCAILDAKELFKSLPHVIRSSTFQSSFFNLENFCRTIKPCNETSYTCIYYAHSHSMCAPVECDCGFNTRQGCHVLHYIVWTRD